MNKTCCFLGHRKIDYSDDLKNKVYNIVEKLITEENMSVFLFGSKSQFNDLCHRVVSELKLEYPHIKRIYVRAEYPHIDESYKNYLLKDYEETYFPKSAINAGKTVYIKRNYEMINKSDCCIVYYIADYNSTNQKSGTKIAYEYAVNKGKRVIFI